METARAKYNTLTPLEAKKFINVRQLQRTASVHNRPRPPPLVLANGMCEAPPGNRCQQGLAKSQLSSSTTKVFQNHLSSLRKFFRYIPLRRSFADSQDYRGLPAKDSDTQSTQTLAESVSQLCLNRSQSPPVFPPPPSELKSMSYMESNVDYSNYDDFTRLRNQQITRTSGVARKARHEVYQQHDDHYGCPDSSWHLNSLPVSFARDLATVFEDKPVHLNGSSLARRKLNNNNNNNDDPYFIRPPASFDDYRASQCTEDDLKKSDPKTSSSHSLTSITTADSVLDYQHQLTSSFKFPSNRNSFEQSAPWTSPGLPPKMPIYETATKTSSCDISDDSAGTNGLNNCDQLKSLETDKSSNGGIAIGETNGLDAEANTTLVSNTSTLQGNSQSDSVFLSRCAELEQQVKYLRTKLMDKDRELTDLQLKVLAADYLIDNLKSMNGKLERENTQLRDALLRSNHRSNI